MWGKLPTDSWRCPEGRAREVMLAHTRMTMKRIRGDRPRTFASTPEAERLAQSLIDGRGIPAEYPEDALHIAVAAIAGMDFIVTWNFSHINNPFTKMMIRQAVENEGYECPEVVSPDAFLGDGT